jgi:hypothetical protein
MIPLARQDDFYVPEAVPESKMDTSISTRSSVDDSGYEECLLHLIAWMAEQIFFFSLSLSGLHHYKSLGVL